MGEIGGEYRAGREFERVVESMLAKQVFEVLLSPDDEGSKVPDFYVRDLETRNKFWMEAKWRNHYYDDKYEIGSKDRFKLYRVFQELVRPEVVYMVLGFGGTASHPDEIYCSPVDRIGYSGVFRSVLEGMTRVRGSFRYEGGQLR